MKKSINRFVIFFNLASILIAAKLVSQVRNSGTKWYEVLTHYLSVALLVLLLVSVVRITVFYCRYEADRRFHERIERWVGDYPEIYYYADDIFPVWTISWCAIAIYAYNILALVILYFIINLYVDMRRDIMEELANWMHKRADYWKELRKIRAKR